MSAARRPPAARRGRGEAPGDDLPGVAWVEAPVAMLLVDRKDRIVFANREAGRLLGRDAGALGGRAAQSVLPAPGAVEPDGGAPSGGARHTIDIVSGDGVPRRLEVARTPLARDGHGATLLTLLDRTRRTQLEREATARCATLADLSQTAMLAQLSAALAHEVNQPLAAVIGNGQAALRFLAEDPPALADVRDCLSDIVANGRRASGVVQRQRALIEGDRRGPSGLSLGEVVAEAVELLRNELLNRGLMLLAEVDEGTPTVTGNRVQLQQVIASLVMQAAFRQASSARWTGVRIAVHRKGEGELRVSVGSLHVAADEVAVEAAPAADLASPGPGLDLATCRVIVEAHGGRLWAAGGGSDGPRVGFDLPVAGAPTRPGDAAAQ